MRWLLPLSTWFKRRSKKSDKFELDDNITEKPDEVASYSQRTCIKLDASNQKFNIIKAVVGNNNPSRKKYSDNYMKCCKKICTTFIKDSILTYFNKFLILFISSNFMNFPKIQLNFQKNTLFEILVAVEG